MWPESNLLQTGDSDSDSTVNTLLFLNVFTSVSGSATTVRKIDNISSEQLQSSTGLKISYDSFSPWRMWQNDGQSVAEPDK